MRLATILRDGKARLAAYRGQDLIDISEAGSGLPGSMLAFVEGKIVVRRGD